MDDFSPAAIAKNVEPLRKLLEARKRLSDLIAYMDGRGDAETLIAAGLKEPEKLRVLVASLSKDEQAAEESEETETKAEGEPNGKSE
jgi:type VI secretion system protein ImpB